jgi:DNA-binding protein YbaB
LQITRAARIRGWCTNEQVRLVQETVTDSNRIVEVTVDSTGSLVDLRLTDRIQRISPDVVARTILTTIGEAKAKVASRTAEIIGETMGSDSIAGRAIAERIGDQLRGPGTGGPVSSDTRAPVREERDVEGRGWAW